jgi:TonB family protein
MSDSWKQWEGQVVDNRFLLRSYLGGSEHSAVFLTERGVPPQKVAIKFVQFDEPDAELQLFRWKHAAKLSHPHLLRTFESGRCHLGDFELLYVVMEYAEENLSQFLPQRPLTPAEARDVLTPALQSLAFLHGEGLVHGHVRPSNILAIEDQLKLSSDGISSADEHAEQSLLPAADPQQPPQTVYAASLRHPSPYDPPEIAKGIVSPAGDIWSLGLTLIEGLTQHLPTTPAGVPQDPLVPDTLPAIFQDIARHCLHRDPQRRWTVVEIAARLNPGSIPPSASAAKPSTAPSPAQIDAAVAPAIIASSPRSAASASVAAAKSEPARPAPPPAPKPEIHTQTVAIRGSATRPRYDLVPPPLKRPPLLPPLPKLNYLPLAVVGALALIGILVGPRLLRHRPPVQQAAAVEPEPAAAKAIPAAAHAKNASKSQQKSSAQKSAPPLDSHLNAAASAAPPVLQRASQSPSSSSQLNTPSSLPKSLERSSTPAPSTAALTSVANPPRVEATAKSSNGSVIAGEVLDQVMPEVSPGARATIRGTVHVAVKLHVDSAGNVASAELFSPGPSRYFADQALQAAHRWDFAPAKVDGHAVPSDWLVRFEFTPSITKAHPTQSTP